MIEIPIGATIDWDKSLTGTPALPTGWVECNGQVIADSSSVYNGIAIRNLNGFGGATKRFIRGSTTSGTTGGADTYQPAGNIGQPSATQIVTGGGAAIAPTGTHGHSFTGTTASYLPSYMEMVKILRYK